MALKKVGLGEYNAFVIGIDNQVYDGTTGTPTKVPGQPAKAVDVQGGLHTHGLIDDAGNAWGWGDNASQWAGPGTTTPITAATKFASGVKQIVPYFTAGEGFAVIKADGSLWMYGNTTQGLSGDGTGGSATTSVPVRVKFPAGTVIIDVWINGCAFALDSVGNVYSWGFAGGQNAAAVLAQGTNSPVSNVPTKVPLPGPAVAICGHQWAVHFLLANGQLYACGSDSRYYGYVLFQLPALPNAPIRVDTLYKFPAAILQISANYMTTYAILVDGSLWAWGENTSGTVGNGQETNMLATNPQYSAPWFNSPQWNLPTNQGGALFQQLPVQVSKGIKFVHLKRGTCYVMYMWAEDASGQLYSVGRNKSYVCWNGKGGSSTLQATQPNLWDVLTFTPIINYSSVFGNVPVPTPPTPCPSILKVMTIVTWSDGHVSTY